jgi:hypothetical protein
MLLIPLSRAFLHTSHTWEPPSYTMRHMAINLTPVTTRDAQYIGELIGTHLPDV